jgi:hypothetical protein
MTPLRNVARPPMLLRGPNDGSKQNFHLNALQFVILELCNLVKPLLRNCLFRRLERLVMTFDNRAAHGALALFIALDARSQRHIKED